MSTKHTPNNPPRLRRQDESAEEYRVAMGWDQPKPSTSTAPFLTPDQVFSLNEKHGWFEFKDAQGDVSRAFAQDAIEMHERIRSAAQDMLAALQAEEEWRRRDEDGALDPEWDYEEMVGRKRRAAIAKATGSAA